MWKLAAPEQRPVLLALLNGVAEQLADEHGDGVLDRVGIDAVKPVRALQVVHQEDILSRNNVSLELNQREWHHHGIAHASSSGLALRHKEREQPVSVGVDVNYVVAVVVLDHIQHHAPERFMHRFLKVEN